MAKGRVELTESARRKAEKAGLLKRTGTGQVRRAGESVVRQQTSSQRAQNAALKALGVRRKNQTTDSNN